MKKRSLLCIFILFLCIFPGFADESSVRTFLPSKSTGARVLPLDKVIGMIAEPDSSPEHILLSSILSEPYSFEWTEAHLNEEVRAVLVRQYGAWLSENLGKTDWLYSVGHGNSDGSISISVRRGEVLMSFVLYNGQVISMNII